MHSWKGTECSRNANYTLIRMYRGLVFSPCILRMAWFPKCSLKTRNRRLRGSYMSWFGVLFSYIKPPAPTGFETLMMLNRTVPRDDLVKLQTRRKIKKHVILPQHNTNPTP